MNSMPVLPAPCATSQPAVQATLDAIQAIHRVADEVRLSPEERLHYLRCVRLNLTAAEDRLAGDDLPPVAAQQLVDALHSIRRAAIHPED